jgi:hypothetical protein
MKNIFRILLKTFYHNKIVYIANTPRDKILDLLDDLFTGTKGFFNSSRIKGDFINFPDGFWMNYYSPFEYTTGYNKSSASLTGGIIDLNKNKTKIEIIIKPNWIFGIFFIAFFIGGLYNMFLFFSKEDRLFLYSGLFLLAFGLPLMFVLAKSSVFCLKKRFENYLGISENENEYLK